ncbi:unnamed protein product [Hymenolepis diminuta]|uniref:Uncharacterized protein n=1 Tax=Hymenolepis diminuta TaxID=6216 RepID=A0A564Y215_HYMDI|nr:unnamed protein product [Hymenolepis diminuta]
MYAYLEKQTSRFIIPFHFVALTSRNILPFPVSATWPSYQGVVEYWSEKTVVRLEPQVQNWRADASYFDLIEIKDPLGNTVQQWRDVKTLEALNLSYSLISCAKGGIRVAPNRCTCKPGWNAESREICVARSGCEDGDCVRGEDCVCHKRFEDNRCEKATVDIGKMTTPGVSKRVANLELDGDFGPELSAVVFVSIEGKTASDYLQIENIPSCSSPALAETSQSGGGLEFNKKVATPGELVTLNLNLLHGHAEGDSINGACLLSTIDVATKNFGTAANRKIDFEATIEAFNGKRIRNDPNWISNSECFSCSWN